MWQAWPKNVSLLQQSWEGRQLWCLTDRFHMSVWEVGMQSFATARRRRKQEVVAITPSSRTGSGTKWLPHCLISFSCGKETTTVLSPLMIIIYTEPATYHWKSNTRGGNRGREMMARLNRGRMTWSNARTVIRAEVGILREDIGGWNKMVARGVQLQNAGKIHNKGNFSELVFPADTKEIPPGFLWCTEHIKTHTLNKI